MISAIAKKRLAFRDADGKFITVKPGEFVSLPDAVKHDPMYAWAVKDGVLVVSEQVISPVTAETPKVPEKVEEPPVEEETPASKKKSTKKKAADK